MRRPALSTHIASAATLLAVLSSGAYARAQDACAAAYEESQVARTDGRLRAAQKELLACVRAECPEFIRSDCARWLSDVEAALPSIVVTATSNGSEVADVAVAFDGQPLLSRIDGRSVPVDPGRHVLTFTREGAEPVSLEVVIREGEKNRAVLARFQDTAPAAPSTAPPPAAEQPRSRGALPYVLAGVGVAGIAGFATLGLIGSKDKHDLERSCAPRCADGPVDAVHTKFILADVSLAIGVLALAGSAYFYFSAPRPSTSAQAATHFAAGFSVTPRSGAAAARWSF